MIEVHRDDDCIIKKDEDTINISLRTPDDKWLTKGFNKEFLKKLIE